MNIKVKLTVIILALAIITSMVCISSDITVFDKTPKELKEFESIVNELKFSHRDQNFNRIEMADYLVTKANEYPMSFASSDALYLAGILYGQIQEFDIAIAIHETSINNGLFSPEQIVSSLLWKIQWQKEYNPDLTENTFFELFTYVDEKSPIRKNLDIEKKKGKSEYFDSIYGNMFTAYMETLDASNDLRKYRQSIDLVLFFFNWFDVIHDEKHLFDADDTIGIKSSDVFFAELMDLADKAPSEFPRVNDFINNNISHWLVTEQEEVDYSCWLVINDKEKNRKEKINDIQELLKGKNNSKKITKNKYFLADFARQEYMHDVSVKQWKEIVALNGTDRDDNLGYVRESLIELALYYLNVGNAEESEKYLSVIKTEFKDTDCYERALNSGLYKWVDEIKSKKGD